MLKMKLISHRHRWICRWPVSSCSMDFPFFFPPVIFLIRLRKAMREWFVRSGKFEFHTKHKSESKYCSPIYWHRERKNKDVVKRVLRTLDWETKIKHEEEMVGKGLWEAEWRMVKWNIKRNQYIHIYIYNTQIRRRKPIELMQEQHIRAPQRSTLFSTLSMTSLFLSHLTVYTIREGVSAEDVLQREKGAFVLVARLRKSGFMAT